jgi:hypothetical protein
MDLRNGFLKINNSAGISSSLSVTGSQYTSGSTDITTIQGSTAGGQLFNVLGTAGQLFSVTDGLSGSLFSVNTISGLPLMEIFSDETVNIGRFGVSPLKTVGAFAQVTGSLTGSCIRTSHWTICCNWFIQRIISTRYRVRSNHI